MGKKKIHTEKEATLQSLVGPSTYGVCTAMFWLDVEVKGEFPIRRLDDLLRRVWLECCGHMSAIETGGLRYSAVVDNEFGPDRNERSMSTKVSESVATRERSNFAVRRPGARVARSGR